MTKGTMLSRVLEELESQKGRWKAIARESGVPYGTLQKIADGTTKNPSFKHVQALHDYFCKNSYLKDGE